jgi:hypothetical protein
LLQQNFKNKNRVEKKLQKRKTELWWNAALHQARSSFDLSPTSK